MTELEVNLKKSIIHKTVGRIIGVWGSKHCSSFVRLALSMSEINENVFNIEMIHYIRKSYPAFKLFFIVSNHFFLHTEQHTCDKLQRGIREVFLSFPGGF